MAEKKWAGTTYGSGAMHRWLIRLLRVVDVRAVYVFAFVFVIPVCVFLPGFRHSMHFFRSRRGNGRLKAFVNAYRNHCVFAEAVIDKFAMYAGKRFDISMEGEEHFKRLTSRPESFMMLSSHIGNYEIAGYSLRSEHKQLNVLVFGGEKESVMANRDRMFAQSCIRMIPVSEDGSHLFEINAALSRGDIVSIPADRIWGSSKSIPVTLLGKEARLPMGPFRVAVLLEQKVLAVHVMKEGARGYRIHVTPLTYAADAPHGDQMKQLAESYAAEIERILSLYPTQWYNYYDFWNDETDSTLH
jgi:predicted LPLAT superfamily acyltransferase